MEDKNSIIRLMTFNILVDKRKDAPYSWENRRDQVVSLLKYYDPDIFCIQEAVEHQKSYLSECFSDYACFGVGRNDGKSDGEQVPIFHRKDSFLLMDEGYFWLSETPHTPGSIGWDARLPRTVVWKKLLHRASNRSFVIANTHYDHVGTMANTNSAQVIQNELPVSESNCAMILCGDFNSPEQSSAYEQVLSSDFIDASAGKGTICYGLPFTYHRFLMDQYTDRIRLQQENDRVFRAIDHVFYHGAIKPLRYGILADNQSGVYPSDHFPVLCDLCFTDGCM